MSIIYETDDISKFKFNKDGAYETKSVVTTHAYIESVETIKVTCESGEISYFNPELFKNVMDKSDIIYLTTVYPEKDQMLIGIREGKYILLAPYAPHSVEKYLQ